MASAGSFSGAVTISFYMRLDMYPYCMSHYMYMHYDKHMFTDIEGHLMNTSDTDNQNDNTTDNPSKRPDASRPFGYWLKAVDRLMAAEFALAFEGEHADRRDWRLLNVVDGTAPARRPLNDRKLRALIERGWIVADGDGWSLTDDGRAAKERFGAIADGIRAKVSDAVSPEDLATTIASLEKIARALGWDENAPLPRGRGRRHGFGPHGFGRHGFGPHGFGPRRSHHDRFPGSDEHGAPHEHPHGHGHPCSGRHGHPRHGDDRAARHAQHAYERGFDAGFSRGRDA